MQIGLVSNNCRVCNNMCWPRPRLERTPRRFPEDIAGCENVRTYTERQRKAETHFQALPGASQNVGPEAFQRHIFKHFQAQARMLAQKPSRDTFSSISRRKPECGPRIVPGTHFQTFPGASQNVGSERFQTHFQAFPGAS